MTDCRGNRFVVILEQFKRNHMKHLPILLSVAMLAGLPAARAQDAPAAAEAPIDLEARKASIVNLQAHIEQQEARLSDVAEDIIRLDKRVEEGVNRVVKLLAGVSDSEASRTNVANTKGEAIEGLKKMIEMYQRKRAEVREALRTGNTDVPLKDLSSDVDEFDERIENRIENILTLTKSFTQHEDYDKYVTTGGGGYGRWGWANQEINEAWRQNRRQTRHTASSRNEAIEALQKSIADHRQRQVLLKDDLQRRQLTDTARALAESDIERIDGIIAARQRQLEELQSSISQPKTQPVGRHQSWETSNLLEDAKADLRDDFFEIFRKYDELNQDRGQIAKLQENLAARKKWIADYEAEQKKQ